MDLETIKYFIDDYPRVSGIIGGIAAIVAARLGLVGILKKDKPSGYEQKTGRLNLQDDPRVGNGGAGMPYIEGQNDEYFKKIAKEFREGKHN